MSVWSDPRVIELAKDFVAATDEVWRLQQGTDPECVFFQEMAEHGHYGGRPGASRQGIYVCAPSGEFLASINSTDPDRVLTTMRQGLLSWKGLATSRRSLSGAAKIKPEHRWEDSYPSEGLVLSMFARDLPQDCDPTQTCAVKWNQDRVWFSKAEARQWLPSDLRPGAKYVLPEPVLYRLAGLHLVDSVKGQTNPFALHELSGSAITVEIENVSGSQVGFKISGATRAQATRRGPRSNANGVATQLLGKGSYDRELQRFTEFEIVALGERWGQTTFNGRRRDEPEGPLGYVFRLAQPDEPRIAPAFIASYDVDWVSGPSRRRFDPSTIHEFKDKNSN